MIKTFKVIIAGSRSFSNYNLLEEKCNKILASIEAEIWIISGCAIGADLLGEKYAKNKGYYLMECPAPWEDIHGKPYKFQIYCKRKQESEREVFGNIHSLQYYIHDIHVNIVFFS